MGGSILPATIYNNKVYLLFGKERSIDTNPGWSDFGGGTEKGETLVSTAIREGSEELTGFLGDQADIKKLLTKYGTYNIDYDSSGHTTYRAHIFPIEYDANFTIYYNNNQRFLQKRLDPNIINSTTIFEKTEIKWFSFDDLKKQKSKFRTFYQNIVQDILDKQNEIQKFIIKKLNNKKIKTKIKIKKRSIVKQKTKKNKKY
jgi:8-oxo-dGTP pyrophosphatase MutT (NUDIX family)